MEKKYLVRGVLLLLCLIVIYPYLLDLFMGAYIERMKFCIDPTTRGTFGDMYGVLNAFLSGLAILGIVFTLYWEKQKEIEKQKEEDYNRLFYLASLSKEVTHILKSYKSSLQSFKAELFENPLVIPQLHLSTDYKRIRLISKKIDQEQYFLTYNRQLKSDGILAYFHATTITYKMLIQENKLRGRNELEDNQRKKNLATKLLHLENQLKNYSDSEDIDEKNKSSIRAILTSLGTIDKTDLLQVFSYVSQTESFVNLIASDENKFDFETDLRLAIDELRKSKEKIENGNVSILPRVEKLMQHIDDYLELNDTIRMKLKNYLK